MSGVRCILTRKYKSQRLSNTYNTITLQACFQNKNAVTPLLHLGLFYRHLLENLKKLGTRKYLTVVTSISAGISLFLILLQTPLVFRSQKRGAEIFVYSFSGETTRPTSNSRFYYSLPHQPIDNNGL